MNIVILDRATIGKDIDLSVFEHEGNLTIFDLTKPEETIERIKDADIVISNKVILGKNELENAPKLKLICVAATGYNNIDIPVAAKQNVIVANVKAYSTESVAQYVFACILFIENSLIKNIQDVKEGKWANSPIFTLLSHPIHDLKGRKLGIIGYGTIGKRVTEIAKVFGMEVLITRRRGIDYSDDFRTDFEQVLEESDFISLHLPLTDATRNLITMKELAMMKPEAVLINTSRGGIVNEDDLYEALIKKQIRFAIVDVLTNEPPAKGNKLIGLDNIIVTPHIAWTAYESRKRLVEGILYNIRKFKEGKADEICIK